MEKKWKIIEKKIEKKQKKNEKKRKIIEKKIEKKIEKNEKKLEKWKRK